MVFCFLTLELAHGESEDQKNPVTEKVKEALQKLEALESSSLSIDQTRLNRSNDPNLYMDLDGIKYPIVVERDVQRGKAIGNIVMHRDGRQEFVPKRIQGQESPPRPSGTVDSKDTDAPASKKEESQ